MTSLYLINKLKQGNLAQLHLLVVASPSPYARTFFEKKFEGFNLS